MAADPPANPYVGPRPFDRRDASRFFGRAREINDVVSLVVARQALLVISPSGAGKSSLLNAGVLPILEARGFDVLPIGRVRSDTSDEHGNIFVSGLMTSLGGRGSTPDALTELLQGRLIERNAPITVLVIDQFEELFTARPERWEDRAGLLDTLRLAMERAPSLRLVLALREDFLAPLASLAHHLPGRLRNPWRMTQLDRRNALTAITKPLEETERRFAEGVAEDLVDQLLRIRLAGETAQEGTDIKGEYVEPVQLQAVCRTLIADLPPDVVEVTAEHLRAHGDVDTVLRRFYDDGVAAVSARMMVRESRIRNWIERTLITSGGTRAAAYQATDETAGMRNDVVQALEDVRLIWAVWRSEARWYELTHDRMIKPIRESNAARRWARRRRLQWSLPAALAVIGVIVAVSSVGLLISANPTVPARAPRPPRISVALQVNASHGTVGGAFKLTCRRHPCPRKLAVLTFLQAEPTGLPASLPRLTPLPASQRFRRMKLLTLTPVTGAAGRRYRVFFQVGERRSAGRLRIITTTRSRPVRVPASK